MQSQALVRQMFPDHGHRQVGAALTANFPGQGKAQMARRISAVLHLAQQCFPFLGGLAVIVPICAGIFPAMVEILQVFILKRLDFLLYELI